ncbi:hypothetical protein CLAFUR0_04695 [Fulvia fulva]|nr:hypothetical protein CLAFUR0_04695 [Fulvia fulva]
MLAKEAKFLFGGLVAPWAELKDLLARFIVATGSHLSRTRTLADRIAFRVDTLTPRASKLQARATKLRTRQERGAQDQRKVEHDASIDSSALTTRSKTVSADELETIASSSILRATKANEHVRRLLEHADLLETVKSHLQQAGFILVSKTEQHKRGALSHIMSHIHTFRCSDSKHLVYAFLGLVDDYHTPNYMPHVTFDAVMQDMTLKVIEKEQDLNILMQAIAKNDLGDNVHGYRHNEAHNRHLQRYAASLNLKTSKISKTATRFMGRFAYVTGLYVGDVASHNLRLAGTGPTHHLQQSPGVQIVPESCYAQRCNDSRTQKLSTEVDQVWILIGLKLPVIVRNSTEFICHVTLWENALPSQMMSGTVVNAYLVGRVSPERLMLTNLIEELVWRWRHNWQLNGYAKIRSPVTFSHCRYAYLRCDRILPACGNCASSRPVADCVYEVATDWTALPVGPELGYYEGFDEY